MSQKEQTELGSLLVELPISYISVLDITVIENANEHARMELRLMAEAPLSKSDMDRAERRICRLPYHPDRETYYSMD